MFMTSTVQLQGEDKMCTTEWDKKNGDTVSKEVPEQGLWHNGLIIKQTPHSTKTKYYT